MKETEKAVLSERISTLQAELGVATLEVERLTREAGHAKELERVKHEGRRDFMCFHGTQFDDVITEECANE